jgi:hypothetical protein
VAEGGMLGRACEAGEPQRSGEEDDGCVVKGGGAEGDNEVAEGGFRRWIDEIEGKLRRILGKRGDVRAAKGGGENIPRWLREDAVPGGHVFARGLRSGDPASRLPQSRSQLLVGVKRPVGPLWVLAEGHAVEA